jgi:hypothetical protein
MDVARGRGTLVAIVEPISGISSSDVGDASIPKTAQNCNYLIHPIHPVIQQKTKLKYTSRRLNGFLIVVQGNEALR